eukprot:TRINITY_DN421_c1_g2_i2.p5 TRINITY_DN421_c1_g2~~TRINITY_DN421_c1_g2_i2.p5  ORF type:complete len:121 (-),score=23.43 TRINITY_DN421_c1_g2_i2:933-1244(-)
MQPKAMQTAAAAAAAAHPIADPSLVQHILAFLRPSLMIRSSCRLFRSANETGQQQQQLTLTADVVISAKLIEWAVLNGLQPGMAQAVCICSGNLDGLRRLRPR